MDLVSVIIPFYNVEAYLDRCISSVVSQSYEHLEIILIDDGSTDRSRQISDEWIKKDIRIRVIHQINRGVSAARNEGLRNASGSWIIQLDSDDYLVSCAIAHLVQAAETTGADMVICDFEKGSSNAFSFVTMKSSEPWITDSVSAIKNIYGDDHSALRYAVPWCKMCRKQLYDGIKCPVGKIFEDIYTTHKLLYRCERIAVLDEPLFYYFQRIGSIMNASFSIKKLDYIQALEERLEFFATHNLDELEQIAYDELLHSLIWEYSRTRDVLHSREGMDYVMVLYRQVYKKGYASQRYPNETAAFLAAFNRNPEWIILYWKVSGRLNHILKRNG